MYNKHQYQVSKNQKVLHKVKKQWITISSVLLMMIGAGTVATTSVSANTSRPVRDPQTYVTNVPSHNRRQTSNDRSDLEGIMTNVVHNIHTQKNRVNSVSATDVRHFTPSITNINHLKMYQSGIYNHNLYTRIKPPFEVLKINHKVALYSVINSNKAHNYGYLKRGKVARILRAFKGYGSNNYLRYEVPLMHHTAFITGNHHQVSYVVPPHSYRHYQRSLNRLLTSSNNRKLRPIRKAFKKLSRKRVRNYKAYAELYVRAYNIRQSLLANHSIVTEQGREHKKYVRPSRKNSYQHRVNHTNWNKRNNQSAASNSNLNYVSSCAQSVDGSINSVVNSYQVSVSNSASQSIIQSSQESVINSDARSVNQSINSVTSSYAQSVDNSMVNSYRASVSNSASASQSQSVIQSSQDSVASSDAQSADKSIANSYQNSVSNSISVVDKSLAHSAANSNDQSIKASIASSYARSADRSIVNSYHNSVSNSVSVIDKSLACSAASSANKSIETSIADSYAWSADNSITNSYQNSVLNSVSAMDRSLAKSAASSAQYSSSSERHHSVPASNHSNSSHSRSNRPSSDDSSHSNSANHSHSNGSKSNSQSKLTPSEISTSINQMKRQTFIDINQDRKMYGEKPLTINQDLQGISSLRSKQLMTDFSHFNADHQLYADIDARTLNKPRLVHTIGENIGSASLGLNYEDGTDNRGKRDPIIYNNKNGNDMAHMTNDSMMNWDANSRWGHRINILHSQYKTIGIGVSYDKNNGIFYLAEDFGLN